MHSHRGWYYYKRLLSAMAVAVAVSAVVARYRDFCGCHFCSENQETVTVFGCRRYFDFPSCHDEAVVPVNDFMVRDGFPVQ
jgi:hypothetical protein